MDGGRLGGGSGVHYKSLWSFVPLFFCIINPLYCMCSDWVNKSKHFLAALSPRLFIDGLMHKDECGSDVRE